MKKHFANKLFCAACLGLGVAAAVPAEAAPADPVIPAEAPPAMPVCAAPAAALEALKGLLNPGDALLAKASRGMKLENILKALYGEETLQ